LADGKPRTDHSTAGAQHAVGLFPIVGHLLAYAIASHHSGLLDGRSDGACLERRLRKKVESWDAAPESLLAASEPTLPRFVRAAIDSRDAFCVAFFVRMVFSCLVDADFLDTERFLAPRHAEARPSWPSDILERMRDALDRNPLFTHPPRRPVDQQRAYVRIACIDAADAPPGLFSLTVPTGGGKTLSSLTFALRHAIRNGSDRVIYVAPFTTIIEQNAQVFRSVLGELLGSLTSEPIIEHHGNLDAGRETVTSRLAAENWDAPLALIRNT